MISRAAFAFLMVFSMMGQAAPLFAIQDFVEIRPDRALYVDWSPPQAQQPTVVLINGLTYSTSQWDRFAKELTSKGLGVLRYDPFGMGKTLLRYAPVVDKIALDEQVQDLHQLLAKLKIDAPLSLLGLSYGGALALAYSAVHPNEVGQILLMAPYTEPLKEQDQWIQSQVWYTRKLNPNGPQTDDELYDFFLRQIVYQVYPKAEPIVLENPFKLEAVFQMTRGVRKFRAQDVVGLLPQKSVHLMIAGADQYVKRSVLMDFWQIIPSSRKESMIVFFQSEHKIPEAIPEFSASWVRRILLKDPLTRDGQSCEGDPVTGAIRCPTK